MYKFEVYKDKVGEFPFRLRASNGEVMLGSERYRAKASALNAIESTGKNVPGAVLGDQTTEIV